MLAPSHWSHSEWKHDDEKRFHLTLGLSVLLHAALLLAWKLPPQVWKAADHAVLTVVLRGAAPLAQSSPATAEHQPDVALLVQKDPAPATFSVPPKALVPGAVVPPAARQPMLVASPARMAVQPTPGRLSTSDPAAVGVTAMLVIDADGRLGQIFWDKLPALTDEQLRRVETVMRQKTYAAGRTFNELVDVLGILKLPPARPEESFAPQLPPAGE
ncbi:MAG: hypothetical protein NTY05_14075 [Rhodocyclales bacterium]|nr:hypothetical protein [Rhodocyclales bacterium]